VNKSFRNTFSFSVLALNLVSIGACSGEPAAEGGTAGTFSTGGSTAGTFGQMPTSGSGGMTTTPLPTGGTFGMAGTFGTSGTATGGTGGTGGADGAGGVAGTVAGGTGGTAAGGAPASDFPANCPAPTANHSANAATRTCWAVTASECIHVENNEGLHNRAGNAVDAAGETTRFATGAKMLATGFTLTVDMGSATMIDGVKVVSVPAGAAAGFMDYAPGLQVAVSTDGATFTPVACGAGMGTTDFGFTPVNARYVKLTQHGVADAWWAVFDLNIYRSGDDVCAGGGTVTTMCTVEHMAI
jgi:hypothetical protein